MKISKRIFLMVMALVMALSVTNTFALTNLKVTDNGNGTVTITAEDAEKIAVTQYDRLGFIKTMGISNLVGGKQSTTVKLDSTLPLKVIGFNDWDALQADDKAYMIGQKNLVYIDFEEGTQSPFLMYEQKSFTINDKYQTTDRNGNSTRGLSVKYLPNGSGLAANIQMGNSYSEISDIMVYEYDVKLESVNSEVSSHIKSVDGNGAAAGWHYLWGFYPNDTSTARLQLGKPAVATKNVTANTWMTLSAVADYKLRVVKYYLDGVYQGENAMISNIHPDHAKPDIFYIGTAAGKNLDVVFDNLRVYEGTDVRRKIDNFTKELDLDRTTVSAIDETVPRNLLRGTYSLHGRSGIGISPEGNKTMLDNKPYLKDGEYYAPVDELCKAWNIKTPSGIVKDSEGYANMSDIAEAMGLNVFRPQANKNSGLVVLAESFEIPSTSEERQTLNNFAFYLRPEAEDIAELYKNSDRYGQHPRVFVTMEDFDLMREKYYSKEDEIYVRWVDQTIAFANSRVGNTPPKQEYTSEGRTTDQRKLISDMHALSIAYYITGDRKYVDEAYSDMKTFCEFPDWNPKAHLDVAETMIAFAIGYDWFYHAFTPEQRKVIEEGVFEKAFEPCYNAFLSTATPMSNAFIASNNHGTVCNGGMVMAALAFMDIYPEECAWFVANSMLGNERNIDQWNTGAWYEGPHYWEYAIIYTVKFIEGLRSVLGSDLGFASLEGLDIAGDAEVGMHGNLGIYNYGDAMTGKYYVPELLWLAKMYNNPNLATKMVKEYTGSFPEGNRRIGEPLALAILWHDSDLIYENAVYPNDSLSTSLNVLTAREGWDKNDTFFGVKGGKTVDAHSQLDSGSFIYENNGERWFIDMGMGTYESGYWDTSSGGVRWKYVPARAEGHSTVITNPGLYEDMVLTKGSETTVAKVDLVDSNDTGLIATVDMSEVLRDVTSATRGFFFTDNRESLVVRDEINMSKIHFSENFNGKTTSNIFGTSVTNYEIVSGETLGLGKNNNVAKITGENRYINDGNWNDKTNTRHHTYEFDVYLDSPTKAFQFYPMGDNRFGLQVGGTNGKVYALRPGWQAVETSATVTSGKWYTFAVEYAMESSLMLIYMDGKLIHTESGLSTNKNAPADHGTFISGQEQDKYAYIDNIRSYQGSYTERDKAGDNVVYWHLIPSDKANVTIDTDNNIVSLRMNNKGCKVEYHVKGGKISTEAFEQPIVSIIPDAKPLSQKGGRVQLKITNVTGLLEITAKITPDTAKNPTPLSDYMKPIADWSL